MKVSRNEREYEKRKNQERKRKLGEDSVCVNRRKVLVSRPRERRNACFLLLLR